MRYFTLFLLLSALIQLSYQSEDLDPCHPQPDATKTHYIIGYGSLINSESKNKTYPETGLNIPVRVTGFARTWSARGHSNTSLSTTYLGVTIDPDSYFNGVIFTVPNATALEKYDLRERFYCRVSVPRKDIEVLRGSISDNNTFPTEAQLDDSLFWIYVTKPESSKFPTEKYPIVQSYVDIFLGGCIQMERKYGLANYSDECVTQTVGWEYPWVNDRVHPRRPFTFQPNSAAIDQLLGRHVKEYYENTYVERIHVGRSATSGEGTVRGKWYRGLVPAMCILNVGILRDAD